MPAVSFPLLVRGLQLIFKLTRDELLPSTLPKCCAVIDVNEFSLKFKLMIVSEVRKLSARYLPTSSRSLHLDKSKLLKDVHVPSTFTKARIPTGEDPCRLISGGVLFACANFIQKDSLGSLRTASASSANWRSSWRFFFSACSAERRRASSASRSFSRSAFEDSHS